MLWNFKIELKDKGVFEKIEKMRGIKIPEVLKSFIAEHNAASPEKYRYMLGADEKVFGAVLSFNENETEADDIFTALKAVEDKNELPFAIDPFGNFICYNAGKDIVELWEHEINRFVSTNKNLKEFVESLY